MDPAPAFDRDGKMDTKFRRYRMALGRLSNKKGSLLQQWVGRKSLIEKKEMQIENCDQCSEGGEQRLARKGKGIANEDEGIGTEPGKKKKTVSRDQQKGGYTNEEGFDCVSDVRKNFGRTTGNRKKALKEPPGLSSLGGRQPA